MHPKFTAELIAALNSRVIAHNEAQPANRVRLADLKKRFAHGYQGDDDAARAASGLENVDRFLGRLAKSEGPFDSGEHPRGRGGKFASKGRGGFAARLPQTKAEHHELQATNPSYEALTSEVVPETRGAAIGSGLRNVAATAAAAGLVLPLFGRHGMSSAAAERIQAAAKLVGRYGLSTPAAAVSYPAAYGTHAAVNRAARAFGRSVSRARFERAAEAVTNAAGTAGEKVGAGIGYATAKGPHILLESLDAAAGKVKSPRVAAARRAGLRAGVVLAAGTALQAPIKGTPLDPEKWGDAYDALSYRTINKAVGTDVLDATIAETLAKYGRGGELAKANPLEFFASELPTLYTRAGRNVITGGTALGAAAGAAGAAEIGHAIAGTRRGDPYRDSHGRFTSKANAITGGAALGGAVAGGLATYLALRHGNIRALEQSVIKHAGTVDDLIRKAQDPAGHEHVAELITKHNAVAADLMRSQGQRIQLAMREDPDYQNDIAALEHYAGSHDSHFKSRLRLEGNDKLAGILSQLNAFKVPGAGKPDTWKTIGQIRAENAGAPGRADKAAHDAVRMAVDSVSPANFEHAIAGLTDAQKATATKWFTARNDAIDGVEGQLAAHKGALDDLDRKIKDAEKAHADASRATSDAKAAWDGTTSGTDEHAKLGAAYEAARQAEADAAAKVTRAKNAFTKKRTASTGVTSPFSGEEIQPATDAEMVPLRAKIRAAAEQRATKAIDREDTRTLNASASVIQKEREKQIADLQTRGHRLMAAHAMLGLDRGDVARRALAPARRASAAHAALEAAHEAERVALLNLTDKKVLAGKIKLVQRGHLPKGISPTAAIELKNRAADIGYEVRIAESAYRSAQAASAVAESKLAKQAGTFRNRITSPRVKQRRVGALDLPVYRAILNDVDRASQSSRDAAHRFLHSPTAQRAGALAQYGLGHAKAALSGVAGAGRDLGRALFQREIAEGSGQYRFDPKKLLIGSPLAIPAAEAARDVYRYGRDQALGALGYGDSGKTKAPRIVRIEKHIDPYTGGGFVGLSVPDPEGEKGERVLLWGEHFKHANAAAQALHVGSRVSAVRQRAQNDQQGYGGGNPPGGPTQLADIHNLPGDVKANAKRAADALGQRMHTVPLEDGHQVRFRPNGDTNFDQVGEKVEKHIKSQFLASGSPSNGRLYYDALGAVVGSHQSPVLKQKQAYRLLTGFNAGGGAKVHGGVFHASADSDFAEQNKDSVHEALRDEVDRVMQAYPPRNDTQKANLIRAVGAVGAQKGLAAADLKPLYERIRAAVGGPENGAGTAAPQAQPQPAAKSAGGARRITPDSMAVNDENEPPDWDSRDLREISTPHAERIAKQLQMRADTDVPDVATAIEKLAAVTHYSHGLGPRRAIRATVNAIGDMARHGGGPNHLRQALRNGDSEPFFSALEAHADHERDEHDRSGGLDKLAIDDLETLIKGVVGDVSEAIANELRVPSGDAGAGEWTSGGGGGLRAGAKFIGGRLVREGGEEVTGRVARERPKTSKTGSNFDAQRIASDVGGFAGGEALGYGGAAAAEKVLARFFPEEAAGAGIINAVRNAFGDAGGVTAPGRAAVAAAGSGAKAVAGAVGRGTVKGTTKALLGGAGFTAGYAGGSALGGAAARGGYALAGRKAPVVAPPPESAGEAGSEAIGSGAAAIAGNAVAPLVGRWLGRVAGDTLGGVAGGPAGAIALGAAGGYLGGVLGRNAYDAASKISSYFSGYDPAATQKALGRALGPSQHATATQAAPASAPRTPSAPGVTVPAGSQQRMRQSPGVMPQ